MYVPAGMPAVYRPRDPRKTPLFRLLEAHYEPVKLYWEQRFEARYGFFCSFWDRAVARDLDCGIWDNGFARIRCDTCRHEMLVAFSCKQRGLCPSCSAKRGAELGAFLIDHVKEDVAHAQWVFTIPRCSGRSSSRSASCAVTSLALVGKPSVT